MDCTVDNWIAFVKFPTEAKMMINKPKNRAQDERRTILNIELSTGGKGYFAEEMSKSLSSDKRRA